MGNAFPPEPDRKCREIFSSTQKESQAVDNVKEAEILEKIDHHRLGTLETMKAGYSANEPVGCTGTIMYEI